MYVHCAAFRNTSQVDVFNKHIDDGVEKTKIKHSTKNEQLIYTGTYIPIGDIYI